MTVQKCCTARVVVHNPVETTYTSLRQNLATALDQVVDNEETVVVGGVARETLH